MAGIYFMEILNAFDKELAKSTRIFKTFLMLCQFMKMLSNF